MKKIIALLLLLIMLLTLCACKGNSDDPSPSTDDGENGIFQPDTALVEAIIKYKKEGFSCDRESVTVRTAIERVELGGAPIYLDFSQCESYFVAVYFDPTAEYSDPVDYHDLTWIGFKGADDIQLSYQELMLSFVFQVNQASGYSNLLTGEAIVGSALVFEEYYPEFLDGVNTKTADTYSATVVYVTTEKGNLYLEARNFSLEGLNCVNVDGEGYYHISLAHFDSAEEALRYFYGSYYDDFKDYAFSGEGMLSDDGIDLSEYSLIKLTDFVGVLDELVKTVDE